MSDFDSDDELIIVVDDEDDWPPEPTEPTPSCLNCDDSGCADCRPEADWVGL